MLNLNRDILHSFSLDTQRTQFLHLFSGARRDGDLANELFLLGLEQRVLVLVENWDRSVGEGAELLDEGQSSHCGDWSIH